MGKDNLQPEINEFRTLSEIAPIPVERAVDYWINEDRAAIWKIFDRFPTGSLFFGIAKGEVSRGAMELQSLIDTLPFLEPSKRSNVVNGLVGYVGGEKPRWEFPDYGAGILGLDDIVETNLWLQTQTIYDDPKLNETSKRRRQIVPIGEGLSLGGCRFMVGVPTYKVVRLST